VNTARVDAPASGESGGTGRSVSLESARLLREHVTRHVADTIVGQQGPLEELLVAVVCRGHAILEGVPGVAKTRLVRSVAEALGLDFGRIQFTPDLLPADITGSEVLDQGADGRRSHRFVPGPVFRHVVLADEINRAPPKTQSALLEAMEERQVTVGGQTHPLPDPFLVLATRNPIEQAGTYPLPEAQLDRFLLMIRVDYPTAEEESEVVRRMAFEMPRRPGAAADHRLLADASEVVASMPIAPHVLDACVRLARATRPGQRGADDEVSRLVEWGAGPRASLGLARAAAARAALHGRPCVDRSDVRAVAHAVLRHRIIPSFEARADGFDADRIVDRLLESHGDW
jgi:MoxR-like ATPase